MKICPKCKLRYPNEALQCFVEGTDLQRLPDPRIGTLLAGRYVVEEVIGEGGMSTVYRARHTLVERSVAVKIMNPLLACDDIVRERFRREARSAQKLAHPNIIEIFDQGDTEDGTSYIVMELLHGESLAAAVQQARRLPVDRAVHVMIQVARGIARAHDLEVIHRDLKPENIFLCRREDGSDLVKLLDFGIAKSRHDPRLTGQGDLFGTPQYMAPERILGIDTGGASDIYALGVVFFEMLVGQLPFSAPDVATFFVKHMNEAPPSLRSLNPLVPPALDELVLKMLAKDAKDRPVDAHRIHADLLAILAAREAPAPPAADAEPTSLAAPLTVPPGHASDHWARRISVLEQMLSAAFGEKHRAPPELRALLVQVNELVRRVVTVREANLALQRKLEEIDLRGREKRAQLGFAVEKLGVDASHSKEDVRDAKEAFTRAAEHCAAARSAFADVHKEVIVWEGRSGFLEPWADLSDAYRNVAAAVDAWRVVREEEKRAQAASETAERVASDLEFQIRELRTALAQHEQDLDDEREKCRAEMENSGSEADAIEGQLLELTSRFCQPLRARPELSMLFRELESATEAAA
ncbi:MAG: serine/threonine protein kinase [Labilithrix sp.]|nr:serine/threonine protein kinase [Labilithrix sp.]